MQRYISLLLALLIATATAMADTDRTHKVTAEYTYIVPPNEPIEVAKQNALDAAKQEAIRTHFGHSIQGEAISYEESNNRNDKSEFYEHTSSYVHGEWVEDLGEPEIKIDRDSGNNIIIHVKIKGKIREIDQNHADIKVDIRCNGTSPQHSRQEFKNQDQIYVAFNTPIKGYVAIYLTDHNTGEAYRLLPYRNDDEASVPVEKDREYIFFDDSHNSNVDGFVMTCDYGSERNDLIVIFSDKPIAHSQGSYSSENALRSLPLKDFNKWLSRIRIANPNLQVINKILVTHSR